MDNTRRFGCTFVKKNPWKYIEWLFIACMSDLSLMFQGVLISKIFGEINDKTYQKAILFLIATVTLMLMRMLIFRTDALLGTKMKAEIECRIKETVFEKMYQTNHASVEVSAGEFANILTTDPKQLAEYVERVWIGLPCNLIFSIVSLGILMKSNSKLTLFVFVPLIFLTVICNLLGQKIQKLNLLKRDAEGEFAEKVVDVSKNLVNIRLSGNWKKIREKLETDSRKLEKISVSGAMIQEFVYYLPDASYYIGVVVILFAQILNKDGFSIGQYMLFENSLSLVNSVFMAYSMAEIEKQKSIVSMAHIEKIGEFIRNVCVQKEEKAEKKSVKPDGKLKIVNFGNYYINQPDSVKKEPENSTTETSEIEILLGKVNVMTGKVGSGKTTWLKALQGFIYHEGYVEYEGKQYRDLSEMRHLFSVGYSPQKPHFFQETFLDNIRLWRPEKEAEYERVLNKTDLKKDISEFSLETRQDIGRDGAALSGGQKLRLSLARMLYEKKDIYFIDDMSSSVDTDTFQKMWTHIIKEKDPCETFVIISNSEFIIKNADKVITL